MINTIRSYVVSTKAGQLQVRARSGGQVSSWPGGDRPTRRR